MTAKAKLNYLLNQKMAQLDVDKDANELKLYQFIVQHQDEN